MSTGDIEIRVTALNVLNRAETPPFTIEDQSDGGDDLRMRYRYLDLRRNPLKEAMLLRHRMAQCARRFLDSENFLEIETPYMINSTPEGARDFLVPSRLNPGKFYALPQSPQTFKQLLMVAGYDRYFQIVRCFRDEDLRADRQPEFTQIDCEMSFVEQEDVLEIFERFAQTMFREIKGIEIGRLPRMTWHEAMQLYGSDKPDIRFGMTFNDLTDKVKGNSFSVFDSAEYVGAIVATGCAAYTRKQLDELTEFVKRPQVGAKGLVWIRLEADGTTKSSIDKFYSPDQIKAFAEECKAVAGDLILILVGVRKHTLSALGTLRLEMGGRLGLRNPETFARFGSSTSRYWWTTRTQRFYAMKPPFTPQPEDIPLRRATRAGSRQRLRLRLQRSGGRRRFGSYPRQRIAA